MVKKYQVGASNMNQCCSMKSHKKKEMPTQTWLWISFFMSTLHKTKVLLIKNF